MKIVLSLLVACAMCVSAQAQGVSTGKKSKEAAPAATAPAPAKAAPAGKMLKGTVVNITDYVSGGKGSVDKAGAQQALNSGHVLGLMIGKKIYLCAQADGSSAMAKLANFAGANVGVMGKTKSRGGYNLLIIDRIENI